MKPTKIARVLVLALFLLPVFSIGQDKIMKVKVFLPNNIQVRGSALGNLEIDHFYTDTDGGIVSEIDETMFKKLQKTTYRYEVLVPDVMKELDSVNKIYYASLKNPQSRVAMEQPFATSFGIMVTPPAFQVKPTFGGYYSFAEMDAAMNTLVTNYPGLVTKTSIGTSIQGRNIWVIKISDNAATDELNEPEVLYMGLQHPREAISGSSMIFLMEYLCHRYALDTRIKDLIDNREIFIIPCLNPDGWEWNRTNWTEVGGNWRKNRRVNGDGSIGVDLNRNWGVDWANCSAPISGSAASCGSATPSADTYWGTAAFSEPETQAVRDFTKRQHLVIGFDQHAYGPYYSLPFGRKALHTMGTKGNQFYTAVPALMGMYNGMRAADSFDALGYEVAGGFKDWMLTGEIGTSIGSGLKDSVWAMTGEGAAGGGTVNTTTGNLGTRNFWAPASQILNLCKSMAYQNIQLAFAAGSYVDIQDNSDMALTALTGTVSFNIKRYGLANAPITVTLVPIENMQSVGAPESIGGLIYYENFIGNISYTLPPSLVNGQRVKYAWKVTTGGYTYSDTVTKFLNPTVLLNDNMQGTFGTNWMNPATGSTATWVFTTSGGRNSTQALSETAAGTNYIANQTQICLYKNTFNLVGTTAAYLTFWTRHRIENFNDKCQVQVSPDGTTWTAIQGSTTIKEPGVLDGSTINGIPALTGIRDNWTPEIFDLDAYRGQAALRLRFVFTSDNDASTFKFEVDDGMFIDDLKMITSSTLLVTLPVNFLSFSGTLQNDQTVRVNWEAVIDQDHDQFVVEHGTDGINFSSIGVGPQMAPYYLIHQQPAQGNNYYRIRQMDKDGGISYSKVITVVVAKATTITIYPNPVDEVLNLKINNKKTDQLKIELADIQGRIIYSTISLVSQNTIEFNIDMKLLQPQVYMLKITSSKGEVIATEKIMKR